MNAWKALPLLCLPCLLPAQSKVPLDLARAQAEAEARNPALKGLDAQVDAAEARERQAVAGYLPRLGVDAQYLFGAQYGSMSISFPAFGFDNLPFPEPFPQETLDLRVDWTLFDGLRGLKQWRAARAEENAARLERAYAGFTLRQQVAVLFYKALAARQLAAAARLDTATLEEHLRLAHDYEESGAGTHFGVLRVRAQHEEALANEQQAEDQESQARLDLAAAMGLSGDARALGGDLPVPRLDELSGFLQPDLDRRADLKAMDLRRQALAEKADSIAFSAWAPNVSVFGDRQYYRYGDFNPEILATNGFPDLEMAGVGLTWNLFNGGLDKARLDEAKADERTAASGFASARLDALREFASWRRRFKDGVRLYDARLRVLAQSDESVRLARLGLKAGTLTDSEVLDAELDLFRARAGLVQAQSDAAEALLKLELLSGKTTRP